ncbi:uncharacterized protein N7482_005085 [Penicillium canariense]|uniref:Uncharacterized protein n=1 Tax=Penicillium canariense TaxID=189055 RepID=A0A9W9I1Q6_9EURO|nr:uncharacterized protein N7482_005085 [Penicillium canariense]KAJ5166304.1 hypothetical protein N7482_005085 [Penicillium canariense]
MLRRYPISLRSLDQQKGVFVLAVLIVIVLMNTLLPLRFGLNARDKRLHSEDRPRYLHHSTFRAESDYRYETKLSKVLRELEIEGQVALVPRESYLPMVIDLPVGEGQQRQIEIENQKTSKTIAH